MVVVLIKGKFGQRQTNTEGRHRGRMPGGNEGWDVGYEATH